MISYHIGKQNFLIPTQNHSREVPQTSESQGVTANGHHLLGTHWDDGNILKLNSGDGYKTVNVLEFIELYT